MKVIYGIGRIKRATKNAVLAIGVFDGIHLGHQALIRRMVKKAKSLKGRAVVITFDPHPLFASFIEAAVTQSRLV